MYSDNSLQGQEMSPLIGKGENVVGRTLHIGVVMGTWYEMGFQYGERSAEYILINYDNLVENDILKSINSGWRTTLKTEDERLKYALSHYERSYQELSFIFPEMNEFIQGIADGAAPWLAKSRFANRMSNFYKIGAIAYANTGHMPPPPGAPFTYDPLEEGHDLTGGCNSTWVSSKITATGETYASRTSQGDLVNSNQIRQISLIGIPKDPNAHVFWLVAPAGGLNVAGAGIMNTKGVAVLTSGGMPCHPHDRNNPKLSYPKEFTEVAMGHGVKDFLLSTGCVIFSGSAHEAATLCTIGTPAYRNKTGRKQVLTTRPCNLFFVDPKESYCVEKTAKRFAIRMPGHAEGADTFMVAANDFQYRDGSYDENLKWRADQPMTMFVPQVEKIDSYNRWWTLYWNIANNVGKIDRELMKRFIVTSHDVYDKDGNLYPAQESRYFNPDLPVPNGPCAHWGYGIPGYPMGGGGNASNSVMVLSSAEVYYNEGHPCFWTAKGHESGYDRPWHYIDLKPYGEFRKALWGY